MCSADSCLPVIHHTPDSLAEAFTATPGDSQLTGGILAVHGWPVVGVGYAPATGDHRAGLAGRWPV